MDNRYIAEERVRNATRLCTRPDFKERHALVGIGGAVTHALLDLSRSIQRVTDTKYEGLLAFADELAEKAAESGDDELLRLAERYARVRMEIDQL
jgi:hypothetical protein